MKDPLSIRMETIETEFEAPHQKYDQAETDSQGQAQDIDDGKCLMPGDIAPSYLPVGFEHAGVGLSRNASNIRPGEYLFENQ